MYVGLQILPKKIQQPGLLYVDVTIAVGVQQGEDDLCFIRIDVESRKVRLHLIRGLRT